jgi:hypothetical protein
MSVVQSKEESGSTSSSASLACPCNSILVYQTPNDGFEIVYLWRESFAGAMIVTLGGEFRTVVDVLVGVGLDVSVAVGVRVGV